MRISTGTEHHCRPGDAAGVIQALDLARRHQAVDAIEPGALNTSTVAHRRSRGDLHARHLADVRVLHGRPLRRRVAIAQHLAVDLDGVFRAPAAGDGSISKIVVSCAAPAAEPLTQLP
jgi:hypothetical protein